MAQPSGLTPAQVEEYLHRSYTRVDGLWFVITEEKYGFDTALELDQAVWKVLPKIQARLLQQQLNLRKDIPGLAVALRAKLTLDRYEFSLDQNPAGLEVALSACPWHQLMLSSGRGHLAERVGGAICGVELAVFGREFNCSCRTPGANRLCREGSRCVFTFEPV
jgi:hypothetical protein